MLPITLMPTLSNEVEEMFQSAALTKSQLLNKA